MIQPHFFTRVIVLLLFTLDNVALAPPGAPESFYYVVVDAGSSGSRVVGFQFHKSVEDGKLQLDKEFYKEEKPGLSDFAENPKLGAESIGRLMEQAKSFVPEAQWSATPAVLMATAGLRLLPREQSKALLDEVQVVFARSPFSTRLDSVTIMTEADEGLFAWVTANFLLERLFGDPKKMLAALDLGGASTQITFPLLDKALYSQFPAQDIRHVTTLGLDVDVYTHSYLGLGINAAQKAILSMNNPEDATDLASECVHPIFKNVKWSYRGVEYNVHGPPNPEIIKPAEGDHEATYTVRIKECTELVKKYIKSKNITPPVGILNFEIAELTHFFDRSKHVGSVDGPFIGRAVRLADIKAEMENSCQNPIADHPFMCVDLAYIAILLEEGYGLQPETYVKIVKHVGDHEITWALGAAFHGLQDAP